MNSTHYLKQFQEILNGNNTVPPYDKEAYINYVKLGDRRIKRWSKVGKLISEWQQTLKAIDSPQHWVLITEPWCGDAAIAHSFIEKSVALNPNITLTIQNRDADGSEIDKYLTNGGKSIPKLIVRDEFSNDMFSWGPRPAEAQAMVMRHKEDSSLTSDEKMIQLQSWYNQDKGVSMQQELNEAMTKVLHLKAMEQ